MKRIILIMATVFLAANGIFADTETVTPTVTATVTETVTATVTPTVTGTVTCTLTVTSTGTPADTKTITQTMTPSLTATGSSTRTATRTITSTLTLTNTMTFTPTFSVTSTATVTCTSSVTPTITITPTPVITPTIPADMYETLKDKLYPNPAKAGDNIYFLTNIGYKDEVVVYSIDGREVLRDKRTAAPAYNEANRKENFSTAGLAPGVYFYKIIHTHQGGRTESSRIEKLVLTR